MAKIIITLEESAEQFVSGVPASVTITTNIPSMIFYTLDGTVPTNASLVAFGEIELPRDSFVELKVLARSPANSPEYSDIFVKVFGTDQSDLDRTRRIGKEGVIVNDLADGYDGYFVLGYGPDGYAGSFTDIPKIDREEIISDSDHLNRPPGAFIVVGKFMSSETATFDDDDPFFRETINSNPSYNPKAMYLDIDNTKDTELNIIGRPWGSMRDINKIWGGAERFAQEKNYVSGDLVRSFYNPKTQTYKSYYFDTADARWVVSKTKLNLEAPEAGRTKNALSRVFKWMYHKRSALR